MYTRGHEKLFQKMGPEANLRYLWGRLAERDLSGAEALAMVGAVHRDLGRSEADDPRLYMSYARFMQAMRREMPGVHDHVVKTWAESHRPGPAEPPKAKPDEPAPQKTLAKPTEPAFQSAPTQAPKREEVVLEVTQPSESSATISRPLIDTGLRQFIRAVQENVGAGEGPEEPGEPEEDDSDSEERDSGSNEGKGGGLEEDEDPEDEPPEPAERRDADEEAETGQEREESGAVGEQEDNADEGSGESGREVEDAEPEEGEAAGATEGPESEAAEASDSEGEAGAGARVASDAPGGEETEWPAEEQPEAAEPLEPFDGEGAEGAAAE